METKVRSALVIALVSVGVLAYLEVSTAPKPASCLPGALGSEGAPLAPKPPTPTVTVTETTTVTQTVTTTVVSSSTLTRTETVTTTVTTTSPTTVTQTSTVTETQPVNQTVTQTVTETEVLSSTCTNTVAVTQVQTPQIPQPIVTVHVNSPGIFVTRENCARVEGFVWFPVGPIPKVNLTYTLTNSNDSVGPATAVKLENYTTVYDGEAPQFSAAFYQANVCGLTDSYANSPVVNPNVITLLAEGPANSFKVSIVAYYRP